MSAEKSILKETLEFDTMIQTGISNTNSFDANFDTTKIHSLSEQSINFDKDYNRISPLAKKEIRKIQSLNLKGKSQKKKEKLFEKTVDSYFKVDGTPRFGTTDMIELNKVATNKFDLQFDKKEGFFSSVSSFFSSLFSKEPRIVPVPEVIIQKEKPVMNKAQDSFENERSMFSAIPNPISLGLDILQLIL